MDNELLAALLCVQPGPDTILYQPWQILFDYYNARNSFLNSKTCSKDDYGKVYAFCRSELYKQLIIECLSTPS
jgi:hypothetical protein